MKYYTRIYDNYNNLKLVEERLTLDRAIKATKFFCNKAGEWATVCDENEVILAIIETKQTTIML